MSGTRANLEHIAMSKVDLGPLYRASADGHENPKPNINPAKKEKVFCNPCTQDRVVGRPFGGGSSLVEFRATWLPTQSNW